MSAVSLFSSIDSCRAVRGSLVRWIRCTPCSTAGGDADTALLSKAARALPGDHATAARSSVANMPAAAANSFHGGRRCAGGWATYKPPSSSVGKSRDGIVSAANTVARRRTAWPLRPAVSDGGIRGDGGVSVAHKVPARGTAADGHRRNTSDRRRRTSGRRRSAVE
eukprot:scaffold11117_cov79-Isochrysis_galbana.AAC.2